MRFSRKHLFIAGGIVGAILILPPILYAFLLSQFAIRTFWLPIVQEKTGYRIKAAECRLSLFGKQTCLIRTMKCSGNGLELAADKVSVELDPSLLIFGREAKIEKMEIVGLDLKCSAKKEKEKEKKKTETKSSQTVPAPAKPTEKPFRWSVRKFRLSNSSLEFLDSGNLFRMKKLGIKAENLFPGKRAEIDLEGILEVSGKQMVSPLPVKTSIAMKMDDEGNMPETLLAECLSEKFRISPETSAKDEFSARIFLNIVKKNESLSIQEASFSLKGKQDMSLAFAMKGEIPQGKNSGLCFSKEFLDGSVYSGTLTMNKFRIAPFADAANGGKKSNVSGEIRTSNLKFSGKGVSPAVWKRNLKADFSADTRNLSFPASLENKSHTIRMILQPLHYLPAALETLNLKKKSPELYELSDRISRILSGKENMKLNKGTIRISSADGIMKVKKFLFEGGTLKKESLEGRINLMNEKLTMEADVDADFIRIPLVLRGTVSKPKIDWKRTWNRFRRKELKNLQDPEKIDETVKKATQLINIFLER